MPRRRVPVRQPTAASRSPFALPYARSWPASAPQAGVKEVFAVALEMAEIGGFGELARGFLGVTRHDVLLWAVVGRMARCPRREPKQGTLVINSNA